MDYDVIYAGDERNAVTVSGRTNNGTRRPGTRTVVVPPGARPTVITGGGSSSPYYRPQYAPQYGQQFAPQYAPAYYGQQDSFASRFGMSTGELIDTGIQLFAAISPLPAAPVAQGDTGTDVDNLMTYQTALWQHAKRDEQLRTLGGLLVRILK
jgi:hypothetical protein